MKEVGGIPFLQNFLNFFSFFFPKLTSIFSSQFLFRSLQKIFSKLCCNFDFFFLLEYWTPNALGLATLTAQPLRKYFGKAQRAAREQIRHSSGTDPTPSLFFSPSCHVSSCFLVLSRADNILGEKEQKEATVLFARKRNTFFLWVLKNFASYGHSFFWAKSFFKCIFSSANNFSRWLGITSFFSRHQNGEAGRYGHQEREEVQDCGPHLQVHSLIFCWSFVLSPHCQFLFLDRFCLFHS